MAKIQAADIATGLSEKEETLPTNATKTVDLTKHKQTENQRNYSSIQNCFRCGEKYKKGYNASCKAGGRTCYKCSKKNHLAQYCKSKNIGQQVKELEISDSSSDFESEVASEESFALSCNKITTDVK